MDALITAAGRALATGDPLAALKCVALRDDPPALALRGIALAQLGELADARALLRRAARGFGPHEALAQARCVVAEAEVALAQRELGGHPHTLAAAAAALAARGDRANATHARQIALRRLLLLGRIDEAAAASAALAVQDLATPALVVVAELATAEIALRRLDVRGAHAALQRAQAAAVRAQVPALQAEVAELLATLQRPAARRWQAGTQTPLTLAEVAALLDSGALVIDLCRRGLRCGTATHTLARRPVLLALLQVLAEAWPGDVDRQTLIARVFRTTRADDSHRARLRVEMSRLRQLLAPLARIDASARGFGLVPSGAQQVLLLQPPIDGDAAALQALLADGAAWSTSALALALGESQRNVQRALADLQTTGRVRSIGQGRVQRWVSAPLTGSHSEFTTVLLLPATLPFA
ncbi:MAG: helix-turn-helix domain-containing protein [Rubrivivax sp.]|nr:helix-turn-helix domain-containing protein [Rubrivivax sp.]